MLPISSENSGGQFNPGFPFTHMDKQERKSGQTPSNNEYSWLKKTQMFLYYQWLIQTWLKHEEWLQTLRQRCLFSCLYYQAVACMGLNRVYKEISNSLEPEKQLRPVLKVASAGTQSVRVLAMEKQEDSMLTRQLMTLFIFYSPTQQTSASMNIQLP